MNKIIIVIALACILSIPVSAHAVGVVSANGFTCTATAAGNNSLVECSGSFPGVTGLFGGTGYQIAHIEYSPDNKRRYFYMSETGCLIMNAADGRAVAIDRSGGKKQFGGFMEAMEWCYSGGKPQ